MVVKDDVVYRTLYRRYDSADPDDIDDAVATADVVAWQAREGGVELRNADAYRTLVAKRTLGHALKRLRKHVYPDRDESLGWSTIPDADVSKYGNEDPAIALDANGIIDKAPVNYAEVLRLHYLEGLTFEDAATRLGVTAECLRKRHERALKWAKKKFR